MYGKKLMIAVSCLLLTACHAPSVSEHPASSVQPVTEEKNTKGDKSLHPDSVTDYDRAAITSLINKDLKDRFGKNGYETVYADYIDFSKKDGILTAEGNYTCYYGGYEVLGFVYTYADEAEYYTLLSADVGKTPAEEKEVNKNPFGREPDRRYEITIARYITITFTHSGSGMCKLILVNSDGKIESEVLSQSGEIDISKKVEVPFGTYELQLYNESGTYSLQWNCTEE